MKMVTSHLGHPLPVIADTLVELSTLEVPEKILHFQRYSSWNILQRNHNKFITKLSNNYPLVAVIRCLYVEIFSSELGHPLACTVLQESTSSCILEKLS